MMCVSVTLRVTDRELSRYSILSSIYISAAHTTARDYSYSDPTSLPISFHFFGNSLVLLLHVFTHVCDVCPRTLTALKLCFDFSDKFALFLGFLHHFFFLDLNGSFHGKLFAWAIRLA